MRIAVLSDIHSNMDGLGAVMADIQGLNVDKIICLGDNIGYGPEPEQVMQVLIEKNILSTLGNHELAILDRAYATSFKPGARKALQINKALLSIPSMTRISRLDPFLIYRGCRFVHGLPPDLIAQYISKVSLTRLTHILDAIKEDVSFVGHTHRLAVYESGPHGMERKKFWKTRVSLAKGHKYIINTGSVGQPRGGYNEATFVVWDSQVSTVESRCVPYDTARTIGLMNRLGIPREYADLLRSKGSKATGK